MSGDWCMSCAAGVKPVRVDPDFLLDKDEEMPVQAESWRKMRSGTQAQLAAGVRVARAVHEHGVKPSLVRDALESSSVSSHLPVSPLVFVAATGTLLSTGVVARPLLG